ncbi:hypothetical protein SPRG_19974 [Saprolegnia parasitica CBS 223.65]|uniref:Arrestin-like N-terminal domain-containing protein n=1 Tax=Saprolegnia parasitica (strain CBS 223.65) TaxID=695850 RepID=A0A067CHW6_SAPPC|nr:hypothetical protein SPRG_19974 [Saprolegnia parasitica CBS 223.65]KDO28760.1 hypothetical protein SPRG_19974 [Saprolegnia parasitica CBS 223.65]|eukprot:XP_012200506.1 hypothetical protein SPRG_19974 [Saprolegnia parasitica CBS 223.65]
MTQDEVKITASLACAYFHPGSAVRGCLEIRTPKDLYVEAGAVQLHGHISVDADLLTVPIVTLANLDDDLATSLQLPDVRSFSGQTGTCIYQSKPSVLFSDTDVHETLRTHFAVGLPDDMCPTFKGMSARAFYILTFILKIKGTSLAQSLHVPVEIYAPAYAFRLQSPCRSPVPAALLSPMVDEHEKKIVPVAVRHGHEIPFEMKPRLMHGRVEVERGLGVQQSHFTIGQHLVRVILHKQAFFPGDTLLVSFDFAAATMACDSVKGALVLEEHLCEHSLEPGKKVATTTLETVIEVTADLLQTNMRFGVPFHAQPSIETDLVSFKYAISFEFHLAGGRMFRWATPVVVVAPLPPVPGHLNVAAPVYNGPSRARALQIVV